MTPGHAVVARLAEAEWARALVLGTGLLLLLLPVVMAVPVQFQAVLPLALVALLLVQRYPVHCLIAFILVRVWLGMLWWVPGAFGINLQELVSGAVFLLAALLCLRNQHGIRHHPYFGWALAYGATICVAALQNLELRVVAELMARFMSPVLLMLLASLYLDTDRYRKAFLAVLPLAGVVPLVIGLYYGGTEGSHWTAGGGYLRLTGAFRNAPSQGMVMAAMITLAVFWLGPMRQRGWWWTAALLGYGGACLVLLGLTYTRTPMVFLAATLLAFFYLRGQRGTVLALLMLMLAGLATSSVLQDRFSDFVHLFTVESDLARDRLGSGRIGIWRRSISAYFAGSPLELLTGYGLAAQYDLEGRGTTDTHHDYLSLFLQLGPLGLVSWVAFQVMVMRRAWRLLKRTEDPWTREVLILALAYGVGVFFANNVSHVFVGRLTMAWLWWMLGGVVFAIERSVKAEEARERDPAGYGSDPPRMRASSST